MANPNFFFEWLKQPSTVKAICTLAGAVGYAWNPDRLTEIIGAVMVFQGLVNAFYDQQPARPQPTVDVAAIEKQLSTEQINEIVRARKAKIAAEKELSAK